MVTYSHVIKKEFLDGLIGSTLQVTSFYLQ